MSAQDKSRVSAIIKEIILLGVIDMPASNRRGDRDYNKASTSEAVARKCQCAASFLASFGLRVLHSCTCPLLLQLL